MDDKILRLLSEDPEAGMSLLMEQYMGLLWSACRLYLNNPEDIRECVQETFLDFYEHRGRFQAGKGTIKAYLYVIAKRKAMKTAGRSQADAWLPLDEAMTGGQDSEEALLDRNMLEQALNKLKEQDSRIIRMKYYEGMTCQEIAHAMGLPLETVKKRQQRSLKKLRRILVALAVLGLLTACAAAAVFRVRFSPSLGIQTMEGDSWYEMTNGPVLAETEQGQVTVANVIWKEETLYVQLEFEAGKFSEESTDLSSGIWYESGGSGQARRSSGYGSRSSDGMLEGAQMRYEHISRTNVQEQYVFHIFDAVCTVDMAPIEQYEDFQEIGLTQTHNGRSIVLRTERSDGKLRADAYVYSDNVWQIVGLNDFKDYYGSTDSPLWNAQRMVDEYSYYYETEAPKDETCVLEVKTLRLQSAGETPIVPIPIPEASARVDIPFTLGGDTYRVSEIRWSRGTGEYHVGSSDEDMETFPADELFIQIEPTELEADTRLYGILASLGYTETRYTGIYDPETQKLNEKEAYEQFHPIADNMFDQYDVSGNYDGCIRLLITDPGELEQDNICLRIDSIYKFWDQTYTFRIEP